MPLLHAIVLGIVQGLTEFLPVSSSGHLALVPWVFGWEELERNPDLNRTFDVALHIGTLVGAVAYFWGDLWGLVFRRSERGKLGLLVVSALPAATVGALLESVFSDVFADEWLIGVMLIVFGVVLWWADRLPERRPEDDWRMRDAVLMGVAQALALQPGVSRSGVTMSMGRWLGFDRAGAARLSFLMSVPVIAGACLLSVGELFLDEGGVPPGFGAAFAWGIAASAVTGFLAVWLLLRAIRTLSFVPYVVYRIGAGAGVIALYLTRL